MTSSSVRDPNMEGSCLPKWWGFTPPKNEGLGPEKWWVHLPSFFQAWKSLECFAHIHCPENWWLEDDSFPFGARPIFIDELLVSGRVYLSSGFTKRVPIGTMGLVNLRIWHMLWAVYKHALDKRFSRNLIFPPPKISPGNTRWAPTIVINSVLTPVSRVITPLPFYFRPFIAGEIY